MLVAKWSFDELYFCHYYYYYFLIIIIYRY